MCVWCVCVCVCVVVGEGGGMSKPLNPDHDFNQIELRSWCHYSSFPNITVQCAIQASKLYREHCSMNITGLEIRKKMFRNCFVI